jgi:hypothetical protein
MDAFEKHIHSLLDDHEVPIDTEELWKNVEPKLGRKPVSRRLIFLLFLLIGLPLGYMFFTFPDDQGPVVNSKPGTEKQSFFGRKGQLVDIQTRTDSQTTESIINPENTGSQTITEKVNNKKEIAPIKANLVDKNNYGGTKENDVKAESKVNTFSSESFDSKPRIILSTNKVATNTAIQPVISLFKKEVNPGLPTINDNAISWSFDLFAGYDYTSKNLGTKTYDYRWYRQQRIDSEKYLEAFNIGFHLNLKHKSGFLAGSGLVYHQVNELFESEGSREIRFFKEGVVQIVTNADGSSYEVTGERMAIEQKNWNKKIYNNYGFLNIPLHLGYSHSAGKLQMEYSTGIDFNIYFRQSGEILGKEGFPVSVSKPQNSIFSNYTTINLNGGIKLLYPFSDRFIIYAEPNFHYNLHSLTVDNYPLEQRYIHTGIRFGTRINL